MDILNSEFEELLEQFFSDMLDEENQKLPSTEGKIVINLNQTNNGLILLIIYLLKLLRTNNTTNDTINNKSQSMPSTNEPEEIKELIQLVESLQQKNKDILDSIKERSSEE